MIGGFRWGASECVAAVRSDEVKMWAIYPPTFFFCFFYFNLITTN